MVKRRSILVTNRDCITWATERSQPALELHFGDWHRGSTLSAIGVANSTPPLSGNSHSSGLRILSNLNLFSLGALWMSHPNHRRQKLLLPKEKHPAVFLIKAWAVAGSISWIPQNKNRRRQIWFPVKSNNCNWSRENMVELFRCVSKSVGVTPDEFQNLNQHLLSHRSFQAADSLVGAGEEIRQPKSSQRRRDFEPIKFLVSKLSRTVNRKIYLP